MSQVTDQPQQHYQSAERNGYGITSLVCGIVSACVGLGPVIGAALGIPVGLVGLSFALANRGRLRRHEADNKRMTITGGALSVLGVAFGIIGAVLYSQAVSKLGTA